MSVKTETFEFANFDYESDFKFAVQLNRRLLTPIGMWRMNLKSAKEKWLSKFLNILCIFILLFIFVPGLIDIILTRDMRVGLDKVGTFSFSTLNTLFYFFFVIHRREIHDCLEIMYDDWRNVNNQENRAIMLKSVHVARYYIIVCSGFMYAGSMSFTIIVPLLDILSSSGNLTTRNLVFAANFLFFDPQVTPNYYVVYCLQFLGAFTCCSLTSGISSIAISFVMHISGQLDILTGFLHLLVNETSNKLETKDKMISIIVQRHIRSLRFAEQLENIMSEICFIEFLNATFGICSLGYSIALEMKHHDIIKMIVHLVLLISYIFSIFIYCYLSEFLLTKCEDIGRQAYMIQWNSLQKKKPLDLILIIMISSKPIKLTAGKMISFSMSCFSSVLKVSAAYFRFLCTFIK